MLIRGRRGRVQPGRRLRSDGRILLRVRAKISWHFGASAGCAEICPCAARAKHNVIVPPGPQQNAKLFLREPLVLVFVITVTYAPSAAALDARSDDEGDASHRRGGATKQTGPPRRRPKGWRALESLMCARRPKWNSGLTESSWEPASRRYRNVQGSFRSLTARTKTNTNRCEASERTY